MTQPLPAPGPVMGQPHRPGQHQQTAQHRARVGRGETPRPVKKQQRGRNRPVGIIEAGIVERAGKRKNHQRGGHIRHRRSPQQAVRVITEKAGAGRQGGDRDH